MVDFFKKNKTAIVTGFVMLVIGVATEDSFSALKDVFKHPYEDAVIEAVQDEKIKTMQTELSTKLDKSDLDIKDYKDSLRHIGLVNVVNKAMAKIEGYQEQVRRAAKNGAKEGVSEISYITLAGGGKKRKKDTILPALNNLAYE